VLAEENWMEYFARPETFPRQAFGAKCHYMTMSMRMLPNTFGQILDAFAKQRKTLLVSSFLPVCRSVCQHGRARETTGMSFGKISNFGFSLKLFMLQFGLKIGKNTALCPKT
jgi:hypothetical protein